jgi:hypothetical protein
MPSPREHIEDIQSGCLNAPKDLLYSYAGAIKRIQQTFPRRGSYLMEFIQNADDAESQFLKIEISKNSILVSNDGEEFSKEDTRDICMVGRSSKSPVDYIGYLGVGFKSVFLVSDCVEIYSGGYQFKFDKDYWENSEDLPWQVIPIWVDEPSVPILGGKTVFNISIKDSDQINKIREETRQGHLDRRTLLFLRNIKVIEIVDKQGQFERKISKELIHYGNRNHKVYLINERVVDESSEEKEYQDHWLTFQNTAEVPREVRNDEQTKEWERQDVNKREVVVAFKLRESDNDFDLIKEMKGTAHIGVFSFMPIKEVKSGLNFLFQADFLTTPGRGELSREALWNKWLAGEIHNLIISKAIPGFIEHERWKMNFANVLYSPEEGHELIAKHISMPLNEYLAKEPLYVAEDGTLVGLDELVDIRGDAREFIGEDFGVTFPGKKNIHSECTPYLGPYSTLTRLRTLNRLIASSAMSNLLEAKKKRKDVEWFVSLYFNLTEKCDLGFFRSTERQYNVEHDSFWNNISYNKAIILTNYFQLVTPSNSYVNPNKIKIPQELRDNLRIVHPKISSSEKFVKFRTYVNEIRHYHNPPESQIINEITKEQIGAAFMKETAINIDESKWKEATEERKFEILNELKRAYKVSFIDLENYQFLTIKTKDGTWKKPKSLILPNEYGPDHKIEVLKHKGLLDYPVSFVSQKFIEDINDDQEIRRWCIFFKELGVDEQVEENKNTLWVTRIGILSSIKYENENEREAGEVGESKKVGYDLESEGRQIEVKASAGTNPSFILTPPEHRTMVENKDSYFLYVVTNVWVNPTLHEFKASDLLDQGSELFTIAIKFNELAKKVNYEAYNPLE